MRERQLPRVQEHALEPLPCELPVPREVAVLVVARQRVADMREMDADLVRASSLEFCLQERYRGRVPWPGLEAPKDRDGALPVCADPDPSLAFPSHELVQRDVDFAHGVAPRSAHQQQIALVHCPGAKLRM